MLVSGRVHTVDWFRNQVNHPEIDKQPATLVNDGTFVDSPYGCQPKNRGGKTPQIIHLFIGLEPLFSPSILGVFPLFLETPISTGC